MLELFPTRQILDPTKQTDFVDDNFKFDENGRKFSERAEHTVGTRQNCSLRAISPSPTVFSVDLYYKHIKTRDCLEKG